MPVAATEEIRPFIIETSDADLEELRHRLAETRWPNKELVQDPSQGVQLATLQALSDYWENEHDWLQCEGELNALPQFKTNIGGLDIHFLHVRSPHANALPCSSPMVGRARSSRCSA
jgi:hypothetical protein